MLPVYIRNFQMCKMTTILSHVAKQPQIQPPSIWISFPVNPKLLSSLNVQKWSLIDITLSNSPFLEASIITLKKTKMTSINITINSRESLSTTQTTHLELFGNQWTVSSFIIELSFLFYLIKMLNCTNQFIIADSNKTWNAKKQINKERNNSRSTHDVHCAS